MDNGDKKEITLDDLAVMVANGFANTATKDDISKLEGEMAGLKAEMAELKQQMAALSSSVNNYLALSDKRYLELKARQNLIVSWVKTIADKTGVKIDLQELEKIV